MFIIAVVLNILSSYFLVSIFNSFLIFFISFFALIVLNIELLSLFKAINETNIFIFSIINFILTFTIFKYKKAKLLKLNFDFARLKNSLLLDKSLIVLFVGFLILITTTLFLSLVMPVLEPDSQTYHFFRAIEFLKQGSLNHFETNDIRALIMPINSEIIYTWLLAFKKNFHGYGIVSYFSYILAICSMWSIFEKFKFAYRKRLYAIFLFSSLSAIIIQMASLQTDLLVGALLINAFALFIKNKIYFSSLALALAFGVKTTGLMSTLGFFVLIIFYEILIEKNKKLTKIWHFLGFLIINFLIFSSYNYFLNLIQFQNPFANRSALLGHQFWGGIKGYIANLIHYFFQGIDFTGFLWGYYLNNEILEIKKQVFNFLHIDPSIGCNVEQDMINIGTDEQTAGFGILGFLVFLPMVFISFFKYFFNKNKRTILLFLFALVFLINILILARAVAFMVFSIRFVVAFVCLSSIILIGVYKKKSFLKPIILFFCLFYMVLVPFHISRMPFGVITKSLIKCNFNLDKFENECFERRVVSIFEIAYEITNTIKEKYLDKKNIAYVKTLQSPALYLKKMEFSGYNIDYLNAGLINDEKLKKYDLVILEGDAQNDNTFNPKDIQINYTVSKNNDVVFKKGTKYNCYYIKNAQSPYIEDALERTCLTYPYLLKNKDFKLDETRIFDIKRFRIKQKIHYFINQNKY